MASERVVRRLVGNAVFDPGEAIGVVAVVSPTVQDAVQGFIIEGAGEGVLLGIRRDYAQDYQGFLSAVEVGGVDLSCSVDSGNPPGVGVALHPPVDAVVCFAAEPSGLVLGLELLGVLEHFEGC